MGTRKRRKRRVYVQSSTLKFRVKPSRACLVLLIRDLTSFKVIIDHMIAKESISVGNLSTSLVVDCVRAGVSKHLRNLGSTRPEGQGLVCYCRGLGPVLGPVLGPALAS
ncbi:hypothetical protein PoB_006191600 [Plakobranchus ocellatus]|uniref:Uncharacterized protein n=1 Tax=Plakobranchus ocellatus TaxID=259542 RepID=A0AAV4CU11_9GAST|nr:hypothetical protein PoB_006191600 [Plakobranchus ocellatus]